MPPLPQAFELLHYDFEAQYKGLAEGDRIYLHTCGHTGTDTLHITYSCIFLSLKAVKCVREFFFIILLFKCIIRIVTREERVREKKIVLESGVFYWSKSCFLSSESFILSAKVPESIICKLISCKKQDDTEKNKVVQFQIWCSILRI